jgi:hypothetical protein
MYKKCPQCSYVSTRVEEEECPSCHVSLASTQLDQDGARPEPARKRTPTNQPSGIPNWIEVLMAYRFYLAGLLLPLVLIGFLVMGFGSSGDVYDRLQVGMTRQEAEEILNPPSWRGRRRFETIEHDDQTIHFHRQSGNFTLVFQGGILVDKYREESP